MEKIFFKADPKRGGDLGNYWHYMLGFFFPAVSYLRLNTSQISGKKLVFDSCNPITDSILEQYLQTTSHSFSFEKMSHKTHDITKRNWKSIAAKIKRKLLKAELILRGDQASIFTYHSFRVSGNQVILPRWDKYLDQYGRFHPETNRILTSTISHLKNWAKNTDRFPENAILIIKRSDPPAVIQTSQGKEARWFPGYGTERRQLNGIKELERFLKTMGKKCYTFVPGDESLESQIEAFGKTNIIIGIRGAELINMVWMKKEGAVIMQESADFITEPIQIKLAEALGLQLCILPHQGVTSPSIELKLLEKELLNLNT